MASASSYSTLVQELYVAYFGRPADYFGLQNFEAALAAANAPTTIAGLESAYSTNAAVKSLVDSFGTSAESAALYGTGSTESFVTAIFENLLNRAPAVAGLTFWVDAINAGTVTKGDAALAIAAGAAANTTAQGQIDATTIANKLAVAGSFTSDLGASSLDITAYSGSSAAAAARALIAGVTSTTTLTGYAATVQNTITDIVNGHVNNTYTLTTGVDTIVGGPGNNVFNAVLDNTAGISAGGQAATLNAFDSITGGTLNNTLNITDFGLGNASNGLLLPAATITGMTTVNISSLEGIGNSNGNGNPLDFTTLGNLTNVNINASNGSDYVKVGANTALVVTDTSTTPNLIYTRGGSTVTVNNNSTTLSQGNFVGIFGGSTTTSATINGGTNYETFIGDSNSGNGKTNTITTVTENGQTLWTTYIASDALTTLNISGSSDSYTDVFALPGTRTLTVTLNGNGTTTDFTSNPVALVDNTATSIVIDSVTAASNNFALSAATATALTFNDTANLSFYQGTTAGTATSIAGQDQFSNYEAYYDFSAPLVKTVTITGAGDFTADLSGLNAAAFINATGAAGVVTVELASASGGALTQSFTGGAGQDIVSVGANQTGTVAGGTASNNEIVLDNIANASVATLSPYTHFSVLGVAGSTYGVFDMSKATGYNAFDVQASGGDVTFTNVVNNAVLTIDGANSHIVTLQTADTTGATDSVTVNLGTATNTTSFIVNQVTLEDSQFHGIATVNLVTNSGGASAPYVITTLADNNLVTLNVSGSAGLTIQNWTDNSETLTMNFNNGVTPSESSGIYLTNLTDNYLTTLTLNGQGAPLITSLNDLATSLAINYNEKGIQSGGTIETLTDPSLAALTITNSQSSATNIFSINNAVSTPALAALNLNGNVAISITGDTVTSGITVAGTTDNAAVSIDLTAAATAGGKTDTVALGNGNDTVHMGAGAGVGVPTTESVNVAWQALAAGGTETIAGISIHSAFACNVGTVALLVEFGFSDFANPAVASSSSFSGVTIATTGAYTLSSVSGSTSILTATTAGTTADPQLSATNTGGTAPTDSIVTLGTTGSTTSSSHSVTLGTGSDTVTDLTAGSTTISITGSASATDNVTADSAHVVHLTVGNGTDVISATATGASISVVAGTGANAVTIGTGDTGTIGFGAHTGTDTVTLGASGTSLTAIVTLSGLNDSTSSTDTISFSADSAATLVGFTQVTAGSVVASGGNTTLLASWVAAADGAAGSAVAGGAAHSVTWFQFQGNTYILEAAAGDNGSMSATNTLVELVGTGYTFAHASSTGNGTLHLLG
jgi:S-layer protein